MIRFVMVWVGDKFGPEYPLYLADQIIRHATQLEEFSVECITDRPHELPEGIRALAAEPQLPGWWQKIALFAPHQPWDVGDTIIYFDLDVVITGRLEPLVDYPGIIRDAFWPCYNSSVMVWRHGEHAEIYDAFDEADIDAPAGSDLIDLLPEGQVNGGDQEWITNVSTWSTFPSGWFPSIRRCKAGPPAGSIGVIFHGSAKPHSMVGWHGNFWKVGGYTALPEMKGVNVTHEQILENVRTNCERDLPWMGRWHDEGKTAVLVCGGPSAKAHVGAIRAHQKRGAKIISVNNALGFLLSKKVTPSAHIMLDARPENAAFVADAPHETTYFLASQVHPKTFEALAGHNVVVWHNGFGTNEELTDILRPWWDEGPKQKPIILVPGGGTVGLRALWMLYYAGFKTIHVYGMDSSYDDDGSHHAYAQALNDNEDTMTVSMGNKLYKCARWMVRQGEEFRETWRDLAERGVTIHVHGRGLIPDMASHLRKGTP